MQKHKAKNQDKVFWLGHRVVEKKQNESCQSLPTIAEIGTFTPKRLLLSFLPLYQNPTGQGRNFQLKMSFKEVYFQNSISDHSSRQ